MDPFIKAAEEKASGSKLSSPPNSSICFSKTLGSNDVGQNFLILSMTEAMKLVVDPGVITRYQADGTYSENVGDPVRVYDDLNNAYNMQLAVTCYYSAPMFFLKGEWDKFVVTREAKPGEVLSFYRYIDENDGYYYVMKISNRLAAIQEDDRAKAEKRSLEDVDGSGSSSDAAAKKLRGDS